MIWEKKGLTKDPSFTFRVKNAESKTEFANNPLNLPKIGKLNIETLIIPQGLSLNEKKTRVQKSHATVPLRGRIFHESKCSQVKGTVR